MSDITGLATEQALARIIELNDFKRMISYDSALSQGQFVVTGPNFQGNHARVGYCVQIRKHVGQFGSDMVFLRHANGSLVVHENNCYCAMNKEQEELARAVFEVLPEDEDYELGYSDCAKVLEVGFLIEKSQSRGTPDAPFSIAITKTTGGQQ
ncbi:plasmid protein [Salmonella enterica]|nr:plasmid protein [Salmonella enterica]EBR4546820.1 plasmid protein [Salmonella enterica]